MSEQEFGDKVVAIIMAIRLLDAFVFLAFMWSWLNNKIMYTQFQNWVWKHIGPFAESVLGVLFCLLLPLGILSLIFRDEHLLQVSLVVLTMLIWLRVQLWNAQFRNFYWTHIGCYTECLGTVLFCLMLLLLVLNLVFDREALLGYLED